MPSPGYCARCSRPLPDPSGGGLCPACTPLPTGPAPDARTPTSRAGSTAVGARKPPAHHNARTASHHPGPARPPDTVDESAAGECGDTPAPPPPPRVPELPPGYELIRHIGGGGMGDVYLAREVAPDRLVAVKFLRAAGSPKALDRFVVEVRAMARLDHPNVVKVISVETAWREPFFTMEYVPGGTLADLTRPGRPPVPPADAARLVLMAAEGVAAVHARGILHRDLKPGNILLCGPPEPAAPDPATATPAPASARDTVPGADPSGTTAFSVAPPPPPVVRLAGCSAKVTDFGLAKRTDRDDGVTTHPGAMGTPCYMSPEAAGGRPGAVGAAADVYGLGATLYQLLTGRPPFDSPTPSPLPEIMRRVLTETPARPRAVRPDVPPGLEGIVAKAMAKDPARRYPTADTLAADLRRFLDGRTPEAPPLTRRRRAAGWVAQSRRRIAAAAFGLAAAAGLVFAGLAMAPVPPPPESVAAAPAPLPPADPQPPVDPVADIQKRLAAGETVELIGNTGLPKWHAWRVTPSGLGESPLADGTCSFQTNDSTLLELLPDPGVTSYRYSVELRQLRRNGAGGPTSPGEDRVALYFGGETRDAAGGRRVTTVVAARYNDVDRNVPNTPKFPSVFRADGVALVQTPDTLPRVATTNAAWTPFTPTRQWPGAWRRVVADVTPEAVRVAVWDDAKAAFVPLKAWTGKELRGFYAGLRSDIEMACPKSGLAAPPSWHPRMPLGVWCHQSSVAIRNATVGPIPP